MLLSATELVKKSYNLYKDNFKLFITYTILLLVPSVVVAMLGGATAAILDMDNASFGSITFAIIFFFLGLAAYLASLWFSLAFIKVIAARYEGKNVQDIKSEIMLAKGLILPVIIASIISGLAVFAGFILLIIPGIIFAIWFAFTLYAVVLDGQKDTDALRFSKKLVQGRWWGVVWRIIVPSFVYLVLTNIFQMPIGFITEKIDSVIIISIMLVLSSVVTIILTPFITSAQTILYIELKRTQPGNVETPAPLSAPAEPPVS